MIDLSTPKRQRGGRRVSANTIFLIAVGAALAVVAGAAAFAVFSTPTPPPLVAPTMADFHRLELRIDGDGVGQLARVWDQAGERDVDTWGVTMAVASPRAVLYTVQAGTDQSASCVILLDGTEVARELAQPFTVATCAWVAER